MQGRTLWLLGALGGAVALYVASRTPRGQAATVDALEEVVSTAKRAGDKLASVFVPRGIRNNNPGNIEWIQDALRRWRGMVARDPERPRYAVFDTAANGVRAIGGELRASIRKGQTLEQAINEWAPPAENDTGAYVRHVASLTGIASTTRFRESDIPAIAAAIIRHECGQQPYKPADIAAWVNS